MASAAGAVLHNWRLKLSALGLAIFLWLLVQTEPRNSETFSAIPILVEVADTTWILAGPPTPAVAELRLGGPAGEIFDLARVGTTIRVPLQSVGSADTLISLSRDWVELAEGTGLTVVSISPANIRVSLEAAITVTLPLAARMRVPSHLALASPPELSPASVRVRGPASRLAGLDSVLLVPFDLQSTEQSAILNIPIDTAGLGGAIVVPGTTTVTARVEDRVVRTLPGLPVRVGDGGVGTDVVVDPIAVAVQLTGARTLVTALDANLVRAWVPPDLLRGMAEGEERRVPVRLEGVPELVIAVPAPDTVTVRRAVQDVGEARGRT